MKTKFSFLLVLLLTLVISTQPAVAKKPLTTITFDDVVNVPGVYTWDADGATLEYVDGTGAHIGDLDVLGPFTYIQSMAFEGESDGDLVISFDRPTTVVGFGVAISENDAITDAIRVDLYGPGNSGLRETHFVSLSVLSRWSEGTFYYDGPAVTRIVIHVDDTYWFTGLWVDNIVFHG